MAQPYLMGVAKVIKPAQLLDKNVPKLSCSMAAMPPFVATLLVAYLGDFLSFVQFGDFGLMENFLHIIFAFSQEYCFWASPGKSWVYYPSTFTEIFLSTLRSFLCLGGCATHKEDRGLFMRPWDICETSILVLTQKQSKLKKVNKFWWATGVGLFPLYTKVFMWHIQ